MENIKEWVVWSILSSLSSAAVVIFAFLLPAYQEQKDRAKIDEVITKYEQVGKGFYKKGLYSEAEKIFERAFEISGNSRYDLELLRIKSRIFKVHEIEEWKRSKFEGIEEGDFLFLIETASSEKEKSEYLEAYGTYLFLGGQRKKAIGIFQRSISSNSKNIMAHINLGNAYDDLKQKQEAKTEYEKALAINPASYEALYNLGAWYYERNDCQNVRKYVDRISTKQDFRKHFQECYR